MGDESDTLGAALDSSNQGEPAGIGEGGQRDGVPGCKGRPYTRGISRRGKYPPVDKGGGEDGCWQAWKRTDAARAKHPPPPAAVALGVWIDAPSPKMRKART